LAELREQLGEIAWSVVEVNAEKVDDKILLYVSQQLDRFRRGSCSASPNVAAFSSSA
jgi:hypothetical protein